MVLWGHAYDLAVTPPYGPWLEVLRRVDSLGEEWPRVPAFVRDAEALANVGSQDTLFAAVVAYFQELSTKIPLVLLLDDLHWADQASLDFLRYLARQIADYRILIVGTYRSDELHRQHPLYVYLPMLVRESAAERLAVRPLNAAGTRALIRQYCKLEAGDQARLERYLADHAEGNPLYAGELLRSLQEDRVLVERDSGWSLGDLNQVQLPPLLLQVIERRLARLSKETRNLLQVAAVMGQEVPLDLWQQLGGVGEETLVESIRQAVETHVLVETPDGVVRFNHALIREALYDGIVVLRRRLLHREIAEALESMSRPDPDLVAYHFEQAGDQRAVEWWFRASKRAEHAYAWRSAAERLEAVARCQEQMSSQVFPPQSLLLDIATLLRYSDPDAALIRLADAIETAELAGDRLTQHLARAERGFVHIMIGRVREGTTEIERAVRSCDRIEAQHPGSLDRADARFSSLGLRLMTTRLAARRSVLIFSWAIVGRLGKALEIGEPLRDRFFARFGDSLLGDGIGPLPDTPFGPDYQAGNTCLGLAQLYAMLGRVEDAQRFFNLAARYFQVSGLPFIVTLLASGELYLLTLPLQADQIDRRRYLREQARNASTRGQGMGPSALADHVPEFAVQLLEGDWTGARDNAEASRKAHSFGWYRDMAIEILGDLERYQGNDSASMALVTEVLPDGPKTEPGNSGFVTALALQRLAADVALDRGNLETARAWLEAHDRWLEWSGAVLGQADGALSWARFHWATGNRKLARERAEQALDLATNPRQPLALISIHRFLGELDTEEQHLAEAEESLRESLQLADACLALFERALTLLAFAELRVAQQQPDEARELLAEVRAICEPLEARPTLERVTTLEAQVIGRRRRTVRNFRPD